MTSHSHYQSYLVPMSNTTVKTCRCYEKYWRQLKVLTFPVVEFNYAIEKSFSYRKYFPHEGLLYHFCINCLNDIVNSIPLRIIEFEMQKGHIGCIFKVRYHCILLGQSCPACVNYIIRRYSSMFFITV